MTAMEQALADMWRSREKQKLPYLLVNDVRGYFAEAPAELLVECVVTAHAIIPGRDPAWIRRDGRMARNGSQELPFLAITGLVHDDRTTALLFLQDESGLLPLVALPGDRRNAVAQCL